MNDEWARDTVQMYSRNELGQVPGHYLKIDGKSVVAYATGTDPKSKEIFKFWNMFTALLQTRLS